MIETVGFPLISVQVLVLVWSWFGVPQVEGSTGTGCAGFRHQFFLGSAYSETIGTLQMNDLISTFYLGAQTRMENVRVLTLGKTLPQAWSELYLYPAYAWPFFLGPFPRGSLYSSVVVALHCPRCHRSVE